MGFMKIVVLIAFICTVNPTLFSQNNSSTKRGTIKVRKNAQLISVKYDHVNYRLIGIDKYGNILDSAVVEFQMVVTIQGIFYSEKTIGSTLTYKMQDWLSKCDASTPIYFKNIKAKDQYGTIIDVPKFEYILGDPKLEN
jgi:hypothetical protein